MCVLGQTEVDQLIARDRDRQIHGAGASSPPFVLTLHDTTLEALANQILDEVTNS